jgi:hypothetical protein
LIEKKGLDDHYERGRTSGPRLDLPEEIQVRDDYRTVTGEESLHDYTRPGSFA